MPANILRLGINPFHPPTCSASDRMYCTRFSLRFLQRNTKATSISFFFHFSRIIHSEFVRMSTKRRVGSLLVEVSSTGFWHGHVTCAEPRAIRTRFIEIPVTDVVDRPTDLVDYRAQYYTRIVRVPSDSTGPNWPNPTRADFFASKAKNRRHESIARSGSFPQNAVRRRGRVTSPFLRSLTGGRASRTLFVWKRHATTTLKIK